MDIATTIAPSVFSQFLLSSIILTSGYPIAEVPVLVSDRPANIQSITIGKQLYDVPNQDPKYRLKTRIGPDIHKQLSQFFEFPKVDKSQVVALRPILKPLADAGDPFAMYWLASTYDLYAYGLGDAKDVPMALKYYNKAADLKMAAAEYLLFNVYRYQFMGQAIDERKALAYLERARLHGDSRFKAEIALEYARMYDPKSPHKDFSFVSRSQPKMMAALQLAYSLDPTNAVVVDWWGDVLYKQKSYEKALKVFQSSDNPNTYEIIAQMYETGKGTAKSVIKALEWYKRQAKEELNDVPRQEASSGYNYNYSEGISNIYRLVCQQQISKADAVPYFQKESYDDFLKQTVVHQKTSKLRANPCVPLAGG